MLKFCSVLVFFISSMTCFAQSNLLYSKADSLLNLAYQNLRNSCNEEQKENLKDDQLIWLKRRDILFKKNEQTIEKINFVQQRIQALSTAVPTNYAGSTYAVDPSGIYQLSFKTKSSNNPIGKIEVLKLADSKMIVNLHYVGAPPGKNMGIIKDTLLAKDNQVVYTTEEDTSCRVVFTFFQRGVRVEQLSAGSSFACGFGRNVHVDGFYERTGSSKPSAILRAGSIGITLQWLGWEKRGVVQVTDLHDGRFKIKGGQKNSMNTDFIEIDGTLKVLTPTNLEFEGIINTQVSYINKGAACVRQGKYHFVAMPGKKYWRLKETANCEGGMVVDYIDLYLK